MDSIIIKFFEKFFIIYRVKGLIKSTAIRLETLFLEMLVHLGYPTKFVFRYVSTPWFSYKLVTTSNTALVVVRFFKPFCRSYRNPLIGVAGIFEWGGGARITNHMQ